MAKTRSVPAVPRPGALVTVDETETFDGAKFERDLEIPLDNLAQAMTLHGPSYWRYGKLHAVGVRLLERKQLAFDIAKRQHENLFAQLNELHRESLLKEAAKRSDLKVTERLIDTRVLQDQSYLDSQAALDALKAELIEMEFDVSVVALGEKIFSKRTDILTTLGYMYRGERVSESAAVLTQQAIARRENAVLKAQAKTITNRRTFS